MARVTLDVGGTPWVVNTREGGEDEVRRLGAMLSERWPQAIRAAGDGGVPQALLLTALMLADELSEAQQAASAPPVADMDSVALSWVADRLESLAEALERAPGND
ncbi:Cell division protein ZapA, inhibits GTPase activity of FtsZ [Sphingomonas sp. OV641]|jgi:hypothetical protein|uniref:cell division protein ZapA n=1 Tax=unclassified Sphingomonas TaxID=196159 RepID=UPI00082A6F70|nr:MULTISPECIES: cell division protein ZapA [unclassified Sphingomonas]SEJ13904.1 Cell division protein ZapA, inhibits GTPase activity of FtsZ [Sphingomonas sp. OV641]